MSCTKTHQLMLCIALSTTQMAQATGHLTLQAGSDINMLAARVGSGGGAINIAATGNVNLLADQSSYSSDEAHKDTKKGWFSKTTTIARLCSLSLSPRHRGQQPKTP
jgi:hypothetical protein